MIFLVIGGLIPSFFIVKFFLRRLENKFPFKSTLNADSTISLSKLRENITGRIYYTIPIIVCSAIVYILIFIGIYFLAYSVVLWFIRRKIDISLNQGIESTTINNSIIEEIKRSRTKSILLMPVVVVVGFGCWIFLFMITYVGHGRPFRSRKFFSRSKEASLTKSNTWNTIK